MGLEVAVSIDRPGDCPVAEASAETGVAASTVSRSAPVEGTVFEEFELDADGDLDGPSRSRAVFTDGDQGVYRFEREHDLTCVCERIETFGCPVVDVRAVEGRLRVVFRPQDVETLRDIVATLRERRSGVRLERLVRSGGDGGDDGVVVDRGRLTDRQREVIETAFRMGYFEHPKGANAQEVAAALGINSATFRGHIAAAESKLLEELLEG